MKTAIDPLRIAVLVGIVLVLPVNAPLFAQAALTPEQLTQRVQRLTELSQRSDAKLSGTQEKLREQSPRVE